MTDQPTTDATHGLSLPHADALWDAVAIPGPTEPTFPMQHERVCRAVAEILDELTPASPAVPVSSPPPDQTADRAAVLLDAAAECNKAGGAYAERGVDAAAGAAFALMETFLRQAGEAEYAATPCTAPNVCEDGGDPCDAHERILGHIEGYHDLCAPDCGQEWQRRLAAEAQQPDTETDEAGFPIIKGNCPACRHASLFLGTGGYPTCSNHECSEPDAATTVLEQYAHEAHPPIHAWRVETRDPGTNQWAPGSHFAHRPNAVERLDTANRTAPLWKDGTPVKRRIVRETTTFTVEGATPAHIGGNADDCPACQAQGLHTIGHPYECPGPEARP